VYTASEHYDEIGEVSDGDWWDPEAKFGSVGLHQSVEYGVRDDLTFLFDSRFTSVVADRGVARRDDQFAGLGDIGLGLRKKLPAKSVSVAVQAMVELPGGYDGEREDYALGSGEVDVEGRFLVRGAVGSRSSRGWNANVGYRLRGGEFDNDLVFGGGLDVPLAGRVHVFALADGVSNLRSEPLDLETMSGSDPRRHGSYLKAGGGLGLRVSSSARIDVALSADLAGENSLRGTGVDLALEILP
jgi:hypothetical protein